MQKQKVVVGMSGGVDSSVSALLLKEMGYEVIGLFMKNWEEKDPEGVCLSSKEYEDVVKVCEHLKIPYYSVNFVEEYWQSVFTQFLEELRLGYTPNPDVLCNREIKFDVFLQKALSLGADFLATGHYCRIASKEGSHCLLKGSDPQKDQSYFLNTLTSDVLAKVLFPAGHLNKKEVRSLAQKAGLSTADKKDSTGICFIGERNFKSFLSRFIPYNKGHFVSVDGKVVGEHEGIAYYTIGQRKGIGIGGPGEAWFVVGKNVEKNQVVVAQGADHPSLYSYTLTASEVSWVIDEPSFFPFPCKAKIRYRQPDQDCFIEKIEDGQVFVRFIEAQRAITPRQSVVFYEGDMCLGGAMIKKAGPSLYE